MINWQKWDPENPPELRKQFLVLDDKKEISVAVLARETGPWGLTWWEAYGAGFIDPVTHYASINLPGEG